MALTAQAKAARKEKKDTAARDAKTTGRKLPKKQTRKVDRGISLAAAKQVADMHAAETMIFQVLFQAYRRAVKGYFGEDLPEGLMKALDTAVTKAMQAAAEAQKDAEIGPVVDEVVKTYLQQEATGSAPLFEGWSGNPAEEIAAAADAVTDPDAQDLFAETQTQMREIFADEVGK